MRKKQLYAETVPPVPGGTVGDPLQTDGSAPILGGAAPVKREGMRGLPLSGSFRRGCAVPKRKRRDKREWENTF